MNILSLFQGYVSKALNMPSSSVIARMRSAPERVAIANGPVMKNATGVTQTWIVYERAGERCEKSLELWVRKCCSSSLV